MVIRNWKVGSGAVKMMFTIERDDFNNTNYQMHSVNIDYEKLFEIIMNEGEVIMKAVGFGSWKTHKMYCENKELSVFLNKYPGCWLLTHYILYSGKRHICILKNFDVEEAEEFITILINGCSRGGFQYILEKYSYFEYHDIDFMYEGVEL